MIAATAGACALALAGTGLRADDSIATIAKGYLDKAISAARGAFTKEEGEGASSDGAEVETEADAMDRVLQEASDAIFHSEGGYQFTQSRWGASPIPFQIEGLEYLPLDETPTNVADASKGIDRRITYKIQARQHRRFHPQTGWGRWIPGPPPHLEDFVLVRENGVWKVAVSPSWAYSLK